MDSAIIADERVKHATIDLIIATITFAIKAKTITDFDEMILLIVSILRFNSHSVNTKVYLKKM